MEKALKYLALFLLIFNILLDPFIAVTTIYAQENADSESSIVVDTGEQENEATSSSTSEESLSVSEDTEDLAVESSQEKASTTEDVAEEETADSVGHHDTSSVVSSVKDEETESTSETTSETPSPITNLTFEEATTEGIFTGSEIQVPVYITNTAAELSEAILRYTIDSEYIDTYQNEKGYFKDEANGASKVYQENGRLVVEYSLGNLAKDYTGAITLQLKTLDNGAMQNGQTIPVQAEIIQKDQSVAKTSVRQYHFVTRQPHVSTSVTETAASDDDDDPAQQVAITYNINFDDNGQGNGSGQTDIKDVSLETVVPETFTFKASDNPSWTFDKTSRTATYTLEPQVDMYDSSYQVPDDLVLTTDESEESVTGTAQTAAHFAFENMDKATDSVDTVLAIQNKVSQVQPLAAINKKLVTDVNIAVTDQDGNKTTFENGDDLTLSIDSLNGLLIDYTLTKPDDLDIADGDTYAIPLPNIAYGISTENIALMIEGEEVGSYTITEDEILITFNENVNQYDSVDMHVNITGSFNKEIFETEEEVLVEVPYSDGTSYTLTLKAEKENYEGSDVKSAGNPYILDENQQKVEVDRNPTHIDWTVRVNDAMDRINEATIIDNLGAGLTILPDSFKVEKIQRNYKNEEIGREKVTDFTPSITDTGFELNMGAIDTAYEITYTTIVDRPDGGGVQTFNNDATIILDGRENKVNDVFTGTWSGDIPIINKEGSLNGLDKINWTVKYNYGRENLGSVTLTDALTAGEIDLASIQIYEVDTDIDGNASNPRLVNTTTENDLAGNVTFPNLDANGKAYLITFTSNVPVGLNGEVKNTITDNLPQPNLDEALVAVNTVPTGNKIGEQHVDEDGNPYIEWTISMNTEKLNIPSIELKDVFNKEYLAFDVSDESLYKMTKDGEIITDFDIEDYAHGDGREGFKLNIPNAGPHEYKFVYRTYYTTLGMQQEEVANEAELIFADGKGNGIGETIKPNFSLKGPKAGISKSGKYVLSDDQSAQEIEWSIEFNRSKINLTTPKITDTFSSGNYTYIDNSLSIIDITNNKNVIVPQEQYTLTINDDKKGFDIQFKENTKSTYRIVYRTTADDSGNGNQQNDAKLTWLNNEEQSNYTLAKRQPGLDKKGEVVIDEDGGKIVNWTIKFNKNKHIIYDFELVDTYTPTSVTLSNLKITDDTGNDVTNQFNNTGETTGGTFTITKENLDAKVYTMTYSTTLSPTEERDDIKNTAVVNYRGGSQNTTKTIAKPTLKFDKKSTSVDRNQETKYIHWSLDVNTDAANKYVNLVDATITDTIPTDQQLVEGSIKIKRPDGVDVTQNAQIEQNSNDFTIGLPNGPYRYSITYATKILVFPSADPNEIDKYNNSALLVNQSKTPELKTEINKDAFAKYYTNEINNKNAKSGSQNDETENIDWTVSINPQGLPIKNAIFTDTLGSGHSYLKDSIKVYDMDNVEVSTELYDLEVAADNKTYTIQFANLNETYRVTYATRLDQNLIGTFNVTNTAELTGGIDNKVISKVQNSTTAQQWFYGGGGSGKTLNMNFKKVDADNNEPLKGVKFQLYRINTKNQEMLVAEFDTLADGTKTLTGQRAGRYVLKEISTLPDYVVKDDIYFVYGYGQDEQPSIKMADATWNPDKFKALEGSTLIVTNEKAKTNVTANKIWEGGSSTHPTVYFKLYRQSGNKAPEAVPEVDIKQLATGTTSVTWENMVAKDAQGSEYTFSVREVDANGSVLNLENYTKKEEGLTVTNTAKPTDITIEKIWDDAENQDNIRPTEVVVQLTADGNNVGEPITLSQENDWKATFTNLETHKDGQPINYSVVETDTPEGYTANVEKDEEGNLTLTNTHHPNQTTIAVEKVWQDNNNQDGIRPDNVTVQLMADGQPIGDPVSLSVTNAWTYTWADLAVNKAGNPIEYSVVESEVDGYETTYSDIHEGKITITNIHEPAKKSIPVTKVWKDADDQDGVRPNTITANLLANGEIVATSELSQANDWAHIFENLPVYQDGQAIAYTVTEDMVNQYTTAISNGVITNSYKPGETSVTVTKDWQDGQNQDGNRPETVEVTLTANGQETEHKAVLSEDGNWTATWSGLPLNEAGEPIKYSVIENGNLDSYAVTINDENHGNIIISNNYTPLETQLTVNKVWSDDNNRDGLRPENIQVQLVADGQFVGEPIQLDDSDNWTYTWTELPVNKQGSKIQYSVVEVGVPEGYKSTSSDLIDQTITLTNTHEPATSTMHVEKVWEDADNQDGIRPENITVQLIADGDALGEPVVLSELNNWSHDWTDLYVNADGMPIEYTVEETSVADKYTTTIEQQGNNHVVIKNSYAPAETDLAVQKIWADADNQDGIRPESVTVQLMANGESYGEPVSLTADNDWTYNWTDLAVNANGQPIEYTVAESAVDGYQASISGIEDGKITITNMHEPDKTDFAVNKVWDDANNQDGIRPEAVTVHLLANDQEIETIDLSEVNNWTYTFANLPVYENGEIITYRVTEEAVNSYETTIEDGVITNSYLPKTTSISVIKDWQDENNQDGIRPDFVEIELMANGEATGQKAILNSENNWTATWNDLALNESGQPIDYTAKELTQVAGYEVSVDNSQQDNIVVTNSHTPEVTDLTVDKVWNDQNNQDGIRPESVTVQLMANGESYGEPVSLTADNNWTYNWTDLAVNSDGQAIEYTVAESAVDGYQASISGIEDSKITITNTHEPDKTEFAVSKVWDDANNQDGLRPDKVSVHLLADGEVVETVELSAENEWKHVFAGLPVNKAGQEITYSVTEDSVNHYSTEVKDGVITNTYTPDETSVTVTKNWQDSHNQDGNRPENIQVQLTANGQQTGEIVTLSAKDNWTYTWYNLPLNKEGQAIDYSVTEITQSDSYHVDIQDENHGNIILTNTYETAETALTVNKVWQDGNDKDGLRPETVTVQLMANGIAYGNMVTLSAESDWEYTWTNLPVNAAGEQIVYTVQEPNVADGYTASVSEVSNQVITLTNTHTPYKRVSVGDYVWIDENKDGLQDATDTPLPGVVLVITDLNGNPVRDVHGKVVGPQVTDKDGHYSFDNLPADQTYVVHIDREASKQALKGIVPTAEGVNDDNEKDSSTWTATSRHLSEDGDRDPSLDFGFIRDNEVPVDPETPEEPEVPVDPETPEEPEFPVDPETPEEPEVPVDPETPEEPEVPVDPESPEEPEVPVDPEIPSDVEDGGQSPVLPNDSDGNSNNDINSEDDNESAKDSDVENDELPNAGYKSFVGVGLLIAMVGSVLLLFDKKIFKSKNK